MFLFFLPMSKRYEHNCFCWHFSSNGSVALALLIRAPSCHKGVADEDADSNDVQEGPCAQKTTTRFDL
jgi:hypothetical protein